MKTIIKIFLSTTIASLFISTTFASNFDIAPVVLKVDEKNKMTSMQIKNNNKEPKTMQVILSKKHMEGQKVVYKKTDEIIATPITFSLPHNKTQLLRVAMKGPVKNGNEYRLSIRELPSMGPVVKENRVNFVSEFSVPVKVGK